MIELKFTDADLYVGAKFICLLSTDRPFTVNKIYEISRLHPRDGYYGILHDSAYGSYSVTGFQSSSLVLYPYDRLSDKEKFLYELSGKLPESLTVN